MAPRPALDRPWPNTYWLVAQEILCGEYPSSADPCLGRDKLRALSAAGVSVYLDLTTPADALRPYTPLAGPRGVSHHRLGIPDGQVPSRALMREILDLIDEARVSGLVVYVHCWGGVGCTGTVAGCWLRRHGATPAEALETLRAHWGTVAKSDRLPHCPETEAQVRFIETWTEQD